MSDSLANTSPGSVLSYEDIVFFRLPEGWVAERDEDGTLVLYDDRPDSGTLRIWAEEYSFSDEQNRKDTIGDLHSERQAARLHDGLSLSYGVVESNEQGIDIQLHRWIVAVELDENRLRVIAFTHTIEAALADEESTKWELSLVNLIVHGAHYADTPVRQSNVAAASVGLDLSDSVGPGSIGSFESASAARLALGLDDDPP